ncbi:MAG: complex I NDUFA9 subunit family protein [Gammaproteobacteria bacterium]|nr:complex I NDUFA9 subunit family protein [Gammaproteobacteria bacterium]MDH3413977.1 complex I NDUFA9 subunit family protein [Gammaproteobacteria bacterium]
MSEMSGLQVTVFGASGFLGRSVIARLLDAGMNVRIAARHPERLRFDAPDTRVALVQTDVRDTASVAAAVEGAQAVVNAVGLYLESGAETFDAIHVQGARTVAEQAARSGLEKLVHVSGIGANMASASKYVRARANGERVVRETFAGAAILRPSVLFGPGDAFLNTIDAITRAAPVFPLFGWGETRMQPIYVGDVADAVFHCIDGDAACGRICELGGPRIYTYRQVVKLVLRFRRRKRLLLPVPFAVWSAQAKLLSLLPSPPLSEDQVVLMRDDNVVGEGVVRLQDLGAAGHELETMLPECLASPNR